MFPRKTRYGLVAMVLTFALPHVGNAEPRSKRKLQIGIRSAPIASTMELSRIDPAFDDLSFDGVTGAHHSTIFGSYQFRPYLRLGFETLVGNSDVNARTTMDFQAAGPFAELMVRHGRLVAAGGLHVGTMLADVMVRDGDATDSGVQSGHHYKSGGVFAGPYASVGAVIGRFEVRVFTKYVRVGSGEKPRMNAFSALYAGLSVGLML